MRTLLIIACLMMTFSGPLQAATSLPARRIVQILAQMQKEQEVTPDKFYAHVSTLRNIIDQEDNDTNRAVYQAILAHMLVVNSRRAQSYAHRTESHPDSLREWSRQDYMQQAALLYAKALSAPQLLHRVPVKDWAPLVARPSSDKAQSTDMLSFIWQNVVEDIPYTYRKNVSLPSYAQLIELHRQEGRLQDAIYLTLDSLRQRGRLLQDSTQLVGLLHEYASCEAAAELYLHLAELPNLTPEQRQDFLQKGLKEYPNYWRRNALKNALRELAYPQMEWQIKHCYYPQQQVETKLKVKNLDAASFALYRLPQNFDEGQARLLDKVLKQGRLVRTFDKRFANTSPIQSLTDTLHWQTPSYGHYAMVVKGNTKAPLRTKPFPQIFFFRVSAMGCFSVAFPNGRLRHIVVDAATGAPIEGAEVQYLQWKKQKNQIYKKQITDKRGISELDVSQLPNMGMTIRICKGADNAMEPININTSYHPFYQATNRANNQVRLFTDRGVYRPGQKVYVAALAYTERGKEHKVCEGQEITLTYFDQQRRELAKHTLKTDAFGLAQDSLVLPDKVLPGDFQVRAQGAQRCSFRVEEYKRPTFEVKFDKPEAVIWPVDSIRICGTVTTYSGVPLKQTRITGTYHWQQNFWRFGAIAHNHAAEPVDTIYTDEDGRFCILVPVEEDKDLYKWGRQLAVQVDALSTYGETQQGHFGLPLCSTPLRLMALVSRWQDRQKLAPWIMNLVGPSDQPIHAPITCSLRRADGKEVFCTQVMAGEKMVPAGLAEVPSGDYTLYARAQVGTDTASCKLPLTLFGMKDEQLPVDTALWVYCPRDTFSSIQPAQVQVGSSLDTAYVFLTMVAPSGIALDTLMTLHRQTKVITIPYLKQYADGAQLHVGLYHKGRFFQDAKRLHLQLPKRGLTLRWHTFRDLLLPGQKEEWRLTVLMPDGSPAEANLMCTLYDASLDAIAKHRLRLDLYDWHRIPMLNAYAPYNYPQYYNLPFALRTFNVNHYLHPRWEQRYFQSPFIIVNDCKEVESIAEVHTTMADKAANRTLRQVPVMATSRALMAGLQAKEEEQSDEACVTHEMVERTSEHVRTQLQELAFFRPNLRTNSQGEVVLAFTLPQGLTSWHLQGLAHTRDMQTAWLDDTIVARKEFMAQLHLPRYLREGDQASITATLHNLSSERQQGKATLEVRDARSKVLLHTEKVENFVLEAKGAATHHFVLNTPKGHPLLQVSWLAETPTAADGEQKALAVLSDEQMITETKSFQLNGAGKWEMDLKKLFAYDHEKASERVVTVEYTTRPIWMALQSLPALTEDKPTDAIAVATSCYATTMAHHIALQVPALREAIAQWDSEEQPASMLHNAELTNLLRQEMPWMDEEGNTNKRRQQLADLMTRAYSPTYLMTLTQQLADMQLQDGTFAWYPGMRGSTYITAKVLRLMARLQDATMQSDLPELTKLRADIIQRGLKALHNDLAIQDKRGEPSMSEMLNFLYILQQGGGSASKEINQDAAQWIEWLKRKADKLTRHQRAQAAVVLYACGEETAAQHLMPELRRLITQPDGCYLAYPGGAHWQSQSKVEHHVEVMEAFHLLAPKDSVVMQGLQRWLLMQKRTQDWEQPISTADAIHALVRTSGTALTDVSTDVITLTDGRKSQQLSSPETALGYLRCRMEVQRPRRLKVQKASAGISWGTVYAQYRMPMSEVQAQREGISIRRDIATEKVLMGDRMHVRYTLTVDQDMEFVCLSAPRMAAAEPDTPLSGYVHWGNIGAYRAIHDARTDYFFDQLPRGTYVVEEDWLITTPGTYQMGAATLRSVYAPAFQAHTSGCCIEVKAH